MEFQRRFYSKRDLLNPLNIIPTPFDFWILVYVSSFSFLLHYTVTTDNHALFYELRFKKIHNNPIL